MCEQMSALRRIIGEFLDTKQGSGDGFEMLFAFTFLIRAFCGRPCEPFFPHASEVSWSFSYNKFLKTSGRNLEECKTLAQLHEIIIPPRNVTFPHVAYYSPTAQSFEKYDGFAFMYLTQDECIAKPGFQCKMGRATPTVAADVAELPASFLVRGNATGTASTLRGWRFVSKAEAEIFFGDSGYHWVPSQLDALRESRS